MDICQAHSPSTDLPVTSDNSLMTGQLFHRRLRWNSLAWSDQIFASLLQLYAQLIVAGMELRSLVTLLGKSNLFWADALLVCVNSLVTSHHVADY